MKTLKAAPLRPSLRLLCARLSADRLRPTLPPLRSFRKRDSLTRARDGLKKLKLRPLPLALQLLQFSGLTRATYTVPTTQEKRPFRLNQFEPERSPRAHLNVRFVARSGEWQVCKLRPHFRTVQDHGLIESLCKVTGRPDAGARLDFARRRDWTALTRTDCTPTLKATALCVRAPLPRMADPSIADWTTRWPRTVRTPCMK